MIVFVSCVKKKENKSCMAKNMYISDYFRKSLSYARSIESDDNIFILSAKYGVLKLNDVIEPYEKTLNNMTKKERKYWAYKCIKQLKKNKINFDEKVCFLCGIKYREFLEKFFKNSFCPIKNLGIGKQLAFYKNNTK